MSEITEKTCTQCKKTKEISEFLPRKTSKDGYRGQCKRCMSLNNALYNETVRPLPPERKPRHREPVGKTRTCNKCGVTKDFSEFRKRPTLIGIDYACRECTSKKEWAKYSEKFEK